MALPASGQISASAINTELGRSSTATLSLASAATGGYVTINTASPSYPNASTPHAMSEWYSYDHDYSAAECYAVSTGSTTTVYWVDSNGVERSDTISPGNGTVYICSQILPYEVFVADLVVFPCGSPCSFPTTSILDAISNPCPC